VTAKDFVGGVGDGGDWGMPEAPRPGSVMLQLGNGAEGFGDPTKNLRAVVLRLIEVYGVFCENTTFEGKKFFSV
jgi:hypothetical protein